MERNATKAELNKLRNEIQKSKKDLKNEINKSKENESKEKNKTENKVNNSIDEIQNVKNKINQIKESPQCGGIKFPDAKEIAKRLGVDKNTFHNKIKSKIKKIFQMK